MVWVVGGAPTHRHFPLPAAQKGCRRVKVSLTLISALATQHIHHNLKLKTIFNSSGTVMMENWHRELISDDPNGSPSNVCSDGIKDNDSEFPLVYSCV